MSGGGTNTTSNAPPAQYLDAYSEVLARARNNANQPYQQYQGNLLAGFSPMQQQGFDVIGSAPGIQAPYINAAAQKFNDATADLRTGMQPYTDEASQGFRSAGNANLQGALTPWQQQAQQGFGAGARSIDPTAYSGDAIRGFESPYTTDVVNATQAQFNEQNAQAQNQLSGNAASRGALGGDRLGVAQAQLAGQQQIAQAPVIAGLRNTGFNQAQQEFNNQQQINLGAQQNTAARQQQAAQGFAGLGGQSLTAAQQQAALQQQAASGFAGLSQQQLGAAQAQGWLNSQAGAGLAGLGNQALSGTLQSGNALLGAGAEQQKQAQQSLNIPYQQFQAQQAYPYQQTGWLSNIALGLGAGSGSSTTSPGPSALSQVAGAGLGAVGLAGATGGFGQNGWLTGGGGYLDKVNNAIEGAGASVAQGGRVGFAGGGGIPGLGDDGGFGEVPDLSVSVIPGGAAGHGAPLIKKDYGSTTTSPHDSLLGTIAKTAGTVAATYFGGPQGFAAASAVDNAVHFNRGGHTPVLPRGFAAGGAPAISVSTDAKGVPVMSVDPSVTSGSHGFSGSPSEQLNSYLTNTAASAHPPAATPAPAPAAPAGNALAGAPGLNLSEPEVNQLQALMDAMNNQGNAQTSLNGSPGNRGGRMVRGFAEGGQLDTGENDDGYTPGLYVLQHAANKYLTGPNMGKVTNRPLGAALGDWFAKPPYGPQENWLDSSGPAITPERVSRGLAALPSYTDPDAPPEMVSPAPPAQPGFGPDYDQQPPPNMLNTGPIRTPHQELRGTWPPAAPDPELPGASPHLAPTAAAQPSTEGPRPPSAPPHAGGFNTTPIPAVPPARTEPRTTERAPTGFGAEVNDSRAAREDGANPWLALAAAGFGMAASKSPHFGQALGEGAVAGINHYVSADAAAKALHAKVLEHRDNLAATQAYREGLQNTRDKNADTASRKADNTNENQRLRIQSTDEWHRRVTDNTARGMDIREAQNEATNHFKDANLQLGAGKLAELNRANVAREGNNTARTALMQQAQTQLENYRRAKDATNYSLTLQRMAAANGKTLDPKEADRQAQLSIAGQGNAPAAKTSAAAGPPQVGDVVDGYTYRGGDPSQQASWSQ